MQGDNPAVEWRADIQSLAFHPQNHDGCCVIHRRAFETLLGRSASETDCEAYFAAHRQAFARAAAAKIARAALQRSDNFHLTSRDLARAGSPA